MFHRLGRDSKPKNPSEVFKDFEASEKVKDQDGKLPHWKDVRVPQSTGHGSSRLGRIERNISLIPPITKVNST